MKEMRKHDGILQIRDLEQNQNQNQNQNQRINLDSILKIDDNFDTYKSNSIISINGDIAGNIIDNISDHLYSNNMY